MKLLGILLLMVSSSAVAANKGYLLNMELLIDGKVMSSPRVAVIEGQKATVSQKSNNKETYIEVVATEGQIQNHKGILVNCVVGFVDDKGQKTIMAKPQVLVNENEPAKIEVGQKGKETVTLNVTATRKTL